MYFGQLQSRLAMNISFMDHIAGLTTNKLQLIVLWLNSLRMTFKPTYPSLAETQNPLLSEKQLLLHYFLRARATCFPSISCTGILSLNSYFDGKKDISRRPSSKRRSDAVKLFSFRVQLFLQSLFWGWRKKRRPALFGEYRDSLFSVSPRHGSTQWKGWRCSRRDCDASWPVKRW